MKKSKKLVLVVTREENLAVFSVSAVTFLRDDKKYEIINMRLPPVKARDVTWNPDSHMLKFGKMIIL